MSSSRTLLRKLRTSFTCIKPRFDPSIILLYIAASVEQYCDITQLNALPENEGILEDRAVSARKYDGAFEDVKIEPVVVPRRVWARDINQVAQFRQEKLTVRPLPRTRGFPAGNEHGRRIDGLRRRKLHKGTHGE